MLLNQSGQVMTLFGQSPTPVYGPELTVALLGMIVVCVCGGWLFVRWLRTGPVSPDPWDAQVSNEMDDDSASALCHRCLSPHDSNVNFCMECGAPVGQYTNLLPFPYLFSVGHTLRLGTNGEFKHSPVIICFFILFSLAVSIGWFLVFAPIYWFLFLRKLSEAQQPSVPESPPATT